MRQNKALLGILSEKFFNLDHIFGQETISGP